MDKNQTKTPTREGKIRQQKSRLLKSGFLNGRAARETRLVLVGQFLRHRLNGLGQLCGGFFKRFA